MSILTNKNPHMQESLVASFMDQTENLSLMGKSRKDLSKIEPAQFDLTKPDMSLRNATGLADISQRQPHLDLTRPIELEMTHDAPGLADISKPAQLELSDLNVSNKLDLTKPNFENSCDNERLDFFL